jgi:hypothetical protein
MTVDLLILLPMFFCCKKLVGQSSADLFQMQKIRISAGSKVDVSHNLFDYVGTKKFSNCCLAVEELIKWIGMQLQVLNMKFKVKWRQV